MLKFTREGDHTNVSVMSSRVMIPRGALSIYPTAQSLSRALTARLGEADAAMEAEGMMTFGAFERRLCGELLGPFKEVGDFGRALLLTKIIDDKYRRRGGAFGAARRFAGFNGALLSFFDELGAGLVTPDDLEDIRGYAPGKEEEILDIYRTYRERLEKQGYMDAGRLRHALVETLSVPESVEKSPTLKKYGGLVLRNIYQFTPYRFELFRRISRRMPVTIVTPLPDGRSKAFGFIVSNLEKFENLGEGESGLSIEFEEPDEGTLAPFRARIFDLAPSPADDTVNRLLDSINILKAPSRYREVEEIASRVMEVRAESGAKWSDFGLVFRDINPYGPIIEDVFSRYKVPFHFRRGVRLSLNQLIKAAMSPFEVIDSGYTRESVSVMLSSPYFSRFSGMDHDAVATLLLDAGIIEGPHAAWKSKLEEAAKKLKKEKRKTAAVIIKNILWLLGSLDKLARNKRAPEFFKSYAKLLEDLGLTPEPFTGGPRSEAIRFRDHNAYAQLAEALAEAKNAAAALKLGAAPVGFDRLKELLRSRIESRHVPEPGVVNKNRVTALNAHDAVGASFRFLFILGLHEGEFPMYLETGAIVNEDEKTKFNERHAEAILSGDPYSRRGRKVFDRFQDKWREESLLFFQASRAAREKLTLSFCERELNGSPLMRSQFIDDTLDALAPGAESKERDELIENAPALAIEKDFEKLADPEEQRMKLLWKLYMGGENEEKLEAMISSLALGERGFGRLREMIAMAEMERGRDSYFYEPDKDKKYALVSESNGQLAPEKEPLRNFLLGDNQARYAPTDLEKYGQCPFRYFAAKIMRLEPVEEPELEIGAREAGTLLHNALELFYGRLIKKGEAKLAEAEDIEKKLEEAAGEAFEDFEKKGKHGDPALWRIEKEKTLSTLRLLLEREKEDQKIRNFLPCAVEAAFDVEGRGSQNPQPPWVIKGPDGAPRRIMGKIDRIDVNKKEKAVRIIDYKLSSSASKYRDLIKRQNMGVTSFQVPIYMILAREYVRSAGLLEEVYRVCGGYRLIRSVKPNEAYIVTDGGGGNRKTEQVDDGVFLAPVEEVPQDKAGDTFESVLMKMIERIESGFFPVDPVNCDFCDFPGLCRYMAAPLPALRGEE